MIGKLGLTKAAQTLGITRTAAPAPTEKTPEQPAQTTADGASISSAATNEADKPVSAKTLAIAGGVATAIGVGLMVAASAAAPPLAGALFIYGFIGTSVGGVVGGVGAKEMISEAVSGKDKGLGNVAQSGNTSVQAMDGDTQKPLVMFDEPRGPTS